MGRPKGISKEEAQRKALRFEDELEKLLKRYNARDYSTKIAELIFTKLDNPKLWPLFPVHHLVHSIEANCAYQRRHSDDVLNDRRLFQITNLYKSYSDPYLQYALDNERNLHLALLAMGQQQFEFQRTPSLANFARYLFLFVENDPLPEVDTLFKQGYGLTIYEWMYMSFAILAYSIGQHRQLITPDNFLNSEITTIPRHAVEPFLKISSLTIREIGKRYKERRNEEPPHLYIFIPSVFYEFPLIAFDDGSYLVVHPHMLLHHSSERLFNICTELDEVRFLQRFGNSFEKYTLRVINEIPNVVGIHSEAELQRISAGKSCDYVIELPDCILLIECKATRYSSKFMTDQAIAKDNSTGKIADAFEQMLAIAKRIREDEQLESFFKNREKPLYGFCITFGEFRFPNSPYYLRHIMNQMPEQTTSREKWFDPLERRPQTVSIETFEQLVRVIQRVNKSPKVLVEEKSDDDYVTLSEDGRMVAVNWHGYLLQYFPQVGTWVLPFLEQIVDKFFTQVMGYSPKWPTV